MNRVRFFRVKGAIVLFALIGLGGLAARAASSFVIPYSDSNLKRVAYEFHYAKKPYSGIAYERYPSGKLGRLVLFWNGKKVLKEVEWYPNGNIMAESHYDFQGRRHGDWKMWHPDGKPKSLTHYVDNLKQGEQWAWHPNGTLVEYNVHKDNATITHKAWIFDGTPFYNYVYQDREAVGVQGGDFCRPQGVALLKKALRK
jgi:antitoxin component YwqK of YwqJK toxin-antitoxin module